MIKATNLPKNYRYKYSTELMLGKWTHSYTLVGMNGGVQLHISGPHVYDGEEHWSAGVEAHSRRPTNDGPPSHDHCWLLKCPCWHDGSSLLAQEVFLPLFMRGDHDAIFLKLALHADEMLQEREKI